MKSGKKGQLRTVYMQNGLDEKIEKARQDLGWSRSYFYKYAITKFLQELTILRETVHEEDATALTVNIKKEETS